MTTPIFDFVKSYSAGNTARFHMPGHKGKGMLGCEGFDITEIAGADVLGSADGIIKESENNLTRLYGSSQSFYSTEGSTLAIKAMLALVSERHGNERPFILAARNVHASFVRAAALLDLDVKFIYSENVEHLCSCLITASDVESAIAASDRIPRAVYLTSPDYLGNIIDIPAISAVCHSHGIPLLVDNAHGAYLRFLPEDIHPISLGADMCTDSAHKTLPVLTGGAYLHISPNFSDYAERARGAMSLFASTSPSYLTLCSLDLCNLYLSNGYKERLAACIKKTERIKSEILSLGFELTVSEPLKIVIKSEEGIASHLREYGVEPEFADGEYTVLMVTPENSDSDFERLLSALKKFQRTENINKKPIKIKKHDRVMTIREAVFSKSKIIPVENSAGRICASPTVSCPPAVPIVISGERIEEEDILLFDRYGIANISVVD